VRRFKSLNRRTRTAGLLLLDTLLRAVSLATSPPPPPYLGVADQLLCRSYCCGQMDAENRPKENSLGPESSFSLNRQAQSLRPAHVHFI
jgi:hypothetical protein